MSERARERKYYSLPLFLCVLNAKAHTQFQTAAEKNGKKAMENYDLKNMCASIDLCPHTIYCDLVNIQFVIYLSGEDFLSCTSCVSLMVCRKIHRKTFSLSCHKCPYLFDIKAIITRVEGKKINFIAAIAGQFNPNLPSEYNKIINEEEENTLFESLFNFFYKFYSQKALNCHYNKLICGWFISRYSAR